MIRTTEISPEAQTKIDEILPMLGSLREMIETEAPDIKIHLMQINDNLRQYPDLVHLLKDEDIAPLYAAMKKASTVAVVATKVKAPKKGGKLDDISNLL